MSVITSNGVIAGFKKAATWSTEVAVTGGIYLYASQISVSGGYGDFLPRDSGLSGKRKSVARLALSVTGRIVCDTTYSQGWLALAAQFLGTESTPSETTVSQGDYLENFDAADSTSGLFGTLAWAVETDRVLAIPSVKITGMTYAQGINDAGTVSFDFVGDTLVESTTNSYSTILGLTQYTYETCTLGGTNHYFRINADGGSGLTSTNNQLITNFTLACQRPHQTKFGLRGALTGATLEPLQQGPLDFKLTIKMADQDDASLNLFALYANKTSQKAELFIDGSLIGSTVNRSLKFQFPYLMPLGSIPAGFDLQNNSSLLQPEITFACLKRSAAPTGMTSVTDLMRMVTIQERSTKWAT